MIETIEASLDNHELRPIVFRFLRGEISSHVTLMQMLTESSLDGVAEAIRAMESAVGSLDEESPIAARVAELVRLYRDNRERCAEIARSLDQQVDFESDAESDADRVAHYSRLFDGLVLESPEASVAAYSLGRKEVLEQSTAEIVDHMSRMKLLGSDRSILQIGCGIGRFEAALSPYVRNATGIDISPRMIESAKERCAGLVNVTLHETTGLDLGIFRDAQLDLVYAVDSFPYIVGVGMSLAQTYFSEAWRVLRTGGDLLILNFSYRESIDEDRIDVVELARLNGFEVLVSGDTPFRLWDGAVFHLRKGRRAG